MTCPKRTSRSACRACSSPATPATPTARKPGQGMNVSMQDGFNLGWKLASVLRKRCAPHLLHTYSAERQAIAKELIDFDREWAGACSASSKGASMRPRRRAISSGTGATRREPRPAIVPSLLTGEATHQHLAEGLTIGMRFHSAPVIRVADAKPVHLGHAVKADGRWRIFAFAGAGDPGARNSGIRALCDFLAEARESPVQEIHPGGRGHRRGDRCPRGFPARPSRTRHRGDAVASCCRGRDATDCATTRRCSAPTSRAAMTSSPCAASIANGAAWWSCGRTNTSRMFCRSMAHAQLAAFFDGFMMESCRSFRA